MPAPTTQNQPITHARSALTSYGLAAASITPIRLKNNAVFRVETQHPALYGSTFALRVHRSGFRRPEETRSELLYLQGLRQAIGPVVPEPVPNTQGELLTTISWPDEDGGGPNVRHCDLLTWIDGSIRRPGTGLGSRSCYRLGELLGRIHAFSESFQPPAGFQLPRWDADGQFTEASPFDPGPLEQTFAPDDLAVLREIEGRVRTVYALLGQDREQFGIIHADFILLNTLFHGRRAQVLDFDDCGFGYYLYDLCPLLGNVKDYPAYPVLSRAFLDGYRSVRPLPSEHERHLDLLIAARHATTCLWAAGLRRQGHSQLDTTAHIAYRMGEIRSYLHQSP